MLTPTITTRSRRPSPHALVDVGVDVRVRLSLQWVAMLLVFAYVDLFGFFRADVLLAAIDGRVATTPLAVDQVFLVSALAYVLLPVGMVVLSLVLRARVARVLTITLSLVYALTVVLSCLGETWSYYLLGSAVEVVLLLAIARTAWAWPRVAGASDDATRVSRS